MALPPSRGSRSLCGTKRPAESDLCDEQPLAKKFGLLHLDSTTNSTDHHHHGSRSEGHATTPRGDPSNDSMLLDDTKYTIYIHDLDREIAEAEDQENGIAFLPRIAEELTSIPRSILSPSKPQGNELVLYSEPASLTVPEEQDCVRRAVIETKVRARKRQAENQHSESNPPPTSSMEAARNTPIKGPNEGLGEGDAMDIDTEL